MVSENSWPYKGSFKTYPKTTHHAIIQACYMMHPRRLWVRLCGVTTKYNAPKGWEFFVDDFGLGIRMNKDHDTAFHFRIPLVNTKKPHERVRIWQQRARENRAKRKAVILYGSGKVPRGVHVLKKDSLKAGNCLVGTENFMRRFNLDKRIAVPAKALEEMKRRIPDAHIKRRIEAAITAAIKRHYDDLRRGWGYWTEEK
jgi:hypothetical protein